MGEHKKPRFLLSADQRWFDAVDDWRQDQRPIPSRAEAIRRLVEIGMAGGGVSAGPLADDEDNGDLVSPAPVYRKPSGRPLSIAGYNQQPAIRRDLEKITENANGFTLLWAVNAYFNGNVPADAEADNIFLNFRKCLILIGFTEMLDQDDNRVFVKLEGSGR